MLFLFLHFLSSRRTPETFSAWVRTLSCHLIRPELLCLNLGTGFRLRSRQFKLFLEKRIKEQTK